MKTMRWTPRNSATCVFLSMDQVAPLRIHRRATRIRWSMGLDGAMFWSAPSTWKQARCADWNTVATTVSFALGGAKILRSRTGWNHALNASVTSPVAYLTNAHGKRADEKAPTARRNTRTGRTSFEDAG